jgi:hypothetical protein
MAASVTADQESVFAFLTDPATHPHVRRIDTHGHRFSSKVTVR